MAPAASGGGTYTTLALASASFMACVEGSTCKHSVALACQPAALQTHVSNSGEHGAVQMSAASLLGVGATNNVGAVLDGLGSKARAQVCGVIRAEFEGAPAALTCSVWKVPCLPVKPCTTSLVSLFTHTLAVVLMARAATGAAAAARAVAVATLLSMFGVLGVSRQQASADGTSEKAVMRHRANARVARTTV